MTLIFLLIAIILIFVPTRVCVKLKIHNFHGVASLKLTLYHLLPFRVQVFNQADEPLEFSYKLFGKIRDINKKHAKEKIKEVAKQSEHGGKKLLYALGRISQYIRKTSGRFRVGIRDRADHTAIIAGCLNGFFIPASKIRFGEKADVIFLPTYGVDVFDGEITCIITFNLANIIHESIRYFCKRRSKWKTQ